ncbi:10117_t:CDS:1 [Paraglomus occultum]|uniref:10117_t:CDS:1 n=1 Tax=Paraglomus occultum TaxID=144539 RepID=A0A9N9BF56_9GLOM|nr:10117_t:CDS:1 [Paraglomus occultum]
MSPKLHTDIMINILEQLDNEYRTLHSCLLLDRQICRIAVQVLWRRPFELLRDRAWIVYPHLISVYLSCLSDSDKITLAEHKIFPLISIAPLFDYPSYLEDLDDSFVYYAVSVWFQNTAGFNYQDTVRVIWLSLMRTFAQRCTHLRRLHLELSLYHPPAMAANILSLISQHQKSLNSFTVEFTICDPESMKNNARLIANVILVQKAGLKEFEVWQGDVDIDKIIAALETQLQTLVKISFGFCSFNTYPLLSWVGHFAYMKELMFDRCFNVRDGDFEILEAFMSKVVKHQRITFLANDKQHASETGERKLNI